MEFRRQVATQHKELAPNKHSSELYYTEHDRRKTTTASGYWTLDGSFHSKSSCKLYKQNLSGLASTWEDAEAENNTKTSRPTQDPFSVAIEDIKETAGIVNMD